jgi:cullin-associated NEDD8-dissociated protein 1
MSGIVCTLNQLLEKTNALDKDERYMATNDLATILSQDIKIDDAMENRICTAILRELDDKSNDVQAVAVKCLATLLKKVQQKQVSEICIKLCTLVMEGQGKIQLIFLK